ncbi:hypothetical protein ACET3Z_018242 [Daucus carota]
MENMDNPAMDFMATNFKIFKFKKNKAFRAQGQYSKFNRTGSNKDTGGNSGGTCLEETDEEENEQMVNLALMANSGDEASSSSSQNDVVTPINAVKINGNLHRTPIIDRSMNVCSDIDCMPCKITAMSTVFNPPILSTTKCSYLCDVETPEPTNASSKSTPTKKKVVPFSKSLWVKRDVKNLVVHNLDVVDETVKFEANDDATSSNDVCSQKYTRKRT